MEMVEVINKERVPVGRIVERDTQLNNGEYHLIVHAWIKDYKSNYLISRRAENKSFGGMWECTGGGVIFGETSIEAAVRESKEEVGLLLKPENGRFLTSYFFEDIHTYTYILYHIHLYPILLNQQTLLFWDYKSVQNCRDFHQYICYHHISV